MSPVQINSIGIIGGVGGLGARLADHWRQRFPDREVLVSGRDTDVSNKNIVQKCDLVIFAVPIQVTDAVIRACLAESRADQIWADITSIKQGPVAAMLESKAQVCGLHPLFGPLPAIAGQPFIYCPARINVSALDSLLAMLSDFDLIEMTPEQHDDVMGVVQCVSHLSDLVMGETLRDSGLDFETIWRVSSPSYRAKLQVMGRMFAQDPGLYIDIATLNQSGPKFTARFQSALDRLKTLIDSGDRELLIKNFDQIEEYLTPEFCAQAYAASQQFMSLSDNEVSVDLSAQKGQVAVFGEAFSHTDQAVNHFLDTEDKVYFPRIREVFQAVAEGRCECGIVPYENSNNGSVLDTLDALFAFEDLQITASRSVAIEQHLLALPGANLTQIQTVASHPQALAQSRAKLLELLPDVSLRPARSTALAAQRLVAQQNLQQAVIGGDSLVQGLGLQILERDLQPAGNETRFIEIKKNQAVVSDAKFVSLVFWFEADKSGNLASVLQLMADHNINLIKLDSRRRGNDYGGYLFFVDAKVSMSSFADIEEAFAGLVSGYRVLGTFDA